MRNDHEICALWDHSRPPTNRGQSYIFMYPPRTRFKLWRGSNTAYGTSSIPRQVDMLNVPVGELENCNLLVYSFYLCRYIVVAYCLVRVDSDSEAARGGSNLRLSHHDSDDLIPSQSSSFSIWISTLTRWILSWSRRRRLVAIGFSGKPLNWLKPVDQLGSAALSWNGPNSSTTPPTTVLLCALWQHKY